MSYSNATNVSTASFENTLWTSIIIAVGSVLSLVYLRSIPSLAWLYRPFARPGHAAAGSGVGNKPDDNKACIPGSPMSEWSQLLALESYASRQSFAGPLSNAVYGVLNISNLDSYMYLLFFKLMIKLLFTGSIMGFFMVIVNSQSAAGSAETDLLDTWSLSYVPDGSDVLWIHFIMSYVFTFFVFYQLFVVYQEYVIMRHRYLVTTLITLTTQSSY